MTRDLTALYQETILEHGQRPRRTGPLAGATHEACLDNPLCGDRITIRLRIEGDRIVDARFEGRGCLISQAAASLFAEAVAGRSAAEATALADAVAALGEEPASSRALGSLEVLAAARAFPARIACVTLAPKAALRALGPARDVSANAARR
jgi:nitrogen fixation protein NifU and related proteins